MLAGRPMKPVLVVMLGGCTFAEMTSLKAAMMKKHNIKPIILTTDIITGDRLISSFIPASTKLAIADAQATMATL
jgi:Sec1 family